MNSLRVTRVLKGLVSEPSPAEYVGKGVVMKIASIVAHKGPFVATINSASNIAHLVDVLKKHNIGAVVVSDDGRRILGIISERDIVRALATHTGEISALKVSELMTKDVYSCTQDDTVDGLMQVMTERKFRHVPVVDEEGGLIAVVSIGDLVRHRLSELADERAALINYITQ